MRVIIKLGKEFLMDKNEKITHLRQLSKTVDSLIEAIENSNPVDDWNYTEE